MASGGKRPGAGRPTLENPKDKKIQISVTIHPNTKIKINALKEHGIKIGEDMDFFGFDCVEVCSMLRPPLPVVQQPESEIGITAAQYLIDRLGGYTGEARLTRLGCKIIPE